MRHILLRVIPDFILTILVCFLDIQITALTRALSLHTRIAYLDQSGMGMGDNGSNEVDFHEFEEGQSESLLGALLYRPGHYDILYR